MHNLDIMIGDYIQRFAEILPSRWSSIEPWLLTSHSERYVEELLPNLKNSEFTVSDRIAVHRTAIVESGAILKGPAIIGPKCFVAAGAYVRGGCWLDTNCILGPGAELKSSFMFEGSKLAHFNFAGDSILGSDVNLEAGSIIANYRNERADKTIYVRGASGLLSTGVEKFGALVGDHSRVGANAVVAPGALIGPRTVIRRLRLCDQEVEQTE